MVTSGGYKLRRKIPRRFMFQPAGFDLPARFTGPFPNVLLPITKAHFKCSATQPSTKATGLMVFLSLTKPTSDQTNS